MLPLTLSPPRALTLSAIILAGGHSRRMGQDKALLTMSNGQPLLARTAEVAQQLTDDVAVVTPWPDRYRAMLPASVRLIQEAQAEHAPLHSALKMSAGPLSGFAQGCQQMTSDWCLLLACDLPYLQSEPLKQWWRWIRGSDVGEAGTVDASLTMLATEKTPVKWQPLCGFYHRSVLSGLMDCDRSAQSFQSWLQTLSIAAYFTLPSQLLINCNTPQDWAQFEASQRP